MHDEPFWSLRRLWYAWRRWLYFVAIDECTTTLWYRLKYDWRPEQEAQDAQTQHTTRL